MEEKNFDNKDWFEYIKKLNDRELSNKSSSGITLWALLGFMGYLVFKVLDALPTIMSNQKSIFITILFVCIFYNLSFIGIMIISICSNSSLVNEGRKLQTKLKLKTASILKISICVIAILGIVLNMYFYINNKIGNLITWTYYVFVFTYIYLIVYTLLKNITKITKIKDKESPKIELNTNSQINRKGLIIYGIFLCIVFAYQCGDIIIKLSIISNIECVKAALQTIGLIYGILIIIYKYLKSIRYSWLLKFERKIIIDGLSSEGIKTYFIKEYLGDYLSDWLKRVEYEIDIKLRAFQDIFEQYNKKYLDFEINENLLVKDINGLEDIITILEINTDSHEKAKQVQDDIADYIMTKERHLSDLMKQGSFSEEEIKLIKIIISKLDEKIRYLDKEFKSFTIKLEKNKINIQRVDNALKSMKTQNLNN